LAKRNLRQFALLSGVDPDRLVFAKTLNFEDHIARLHLADLALDTFPYSGGATTSNSLWAGVPVVTLQGETYTSRMSASLLKSVHLTRLITKNISDYEKLITKITNKKSLLTSAKKTLSSNCKCLFNIKNYAKHLEKNYIKIANE